jgi:two-component system, chemotaxis family, CheB/CheR fusion protein
VFAELERVAVPALFEGKGPRDTVRVWTVGCATGEEAYSLAMLLHEEADRHARGAAPVQVFASDLHEASLRRARQGGTRHDRGDVPEVRLRRFFEREHGGYRVRKEVRETICVFAPHNVLSTALLAPRPADLPQHADLSRARRRSAT